MKNYDPVKAWTWRAILTITAALMIGACTLMSCGKSEMVEPQYLTSNQKQSEEMAKQKDSVEVIYNLVPDSTNSIVCLAEIIKNGNSLKTSGNSKLGFTLKKGDVLEIKMRVSFYKEKGEPYNYFSIETEDSKVLYKLDKPTSVDEQGIFFYEGKYTI